MKGKLHKIKDEWFVEYTTYKTIGVVKGVMGSGHKIKDTQYLLLHPDDVKQIDEDSKVFDNIEARIAAYPEVDFEISVCIPPNLEPTRGETISFDAIKYARIIREDFTEYYEGAEPNEDLKNAALRYNSELEKANELLIELEEWDHTCGDGCCYTYGIDIFVNGERIEDEDGTNPQQLLTAVLNKLGYTNVKVEYKYNEQDTTR